MRADKRFPAPGRERGVMLIEALVAILIFSIGILAVVGMQAVAIKDVTAAKYRSEAAFLAQELLAQMWTDNGISALTHTPERERLPQKSRPGSTRCNPGFQTGRASLRS